MRAVRAQKGPSQRNVAGLAGLTQGAVSRAEAGTLSMTCDTLMRICAALDVRPWALIAYADMLDGSPYREQLSALALALTWARTDPARWDAVRQIIDLAQAGGPRWEIVRALAITPRDETIP